MRLLPLSQHGASKTAKCLRRITGAAILFLLLCGISLPASSAATKSSSLPPAKILSRPASVSHSSHATFVFYSTYYDVDAYLCSLDRHAFRSCTLTKTYRGLKAGAHRFAVKIVSDGVIGPETAYTWTVKDRPKRETAPTAYINSHPGLNTGSTSALFRFSSNKKKATYKCALEEGSSATLDFYSCKSPINYTGLTPGYHIFAVKASAGGRTSHEKKYAWYISALAPVNTSLPTVTGTAQVGQTLTTTSGSWTGSLPISYSYQWQLCSSGMLVIEMPVSTAPMSCGDIAGATGTSYTLQSAGVLVGAAATYSDYAAYTGYYTVRVVVTASNAGGQAEAVSSQTSTVLPAAPVNTALPQVEGVSSPPVVGDTAWPDYGDWLNYPSSYGLQWQRCDASGNNCSDISGATSYDYSLTTDDLGSTLRIVVTASNPGGSATATSPPTDVVGPAGP
jgi:hypothetical protein